jgi:hypothetical protein
MLFELRLQSNDHIGKRGCLNAVIPGRAKREPGIQKHAQCLHLWIPGSGLRPAPE